MSRFELDLVVLVADADQSEVLKSLLSNRSESLNIRRPRYEVLKHPQRDAGCLQNGLDLLQPFLRRAERALVVLDHQGSGKEETGGPDVAEELKERLSSSGWRGRAEVIVIEPELEAWVFSDSPHVERVLGWEGRTPGLREWMSREGLWPAGASKPPEPKESLRRALRAAGVKPSAALYGDLARTVSMERCADLTFKRLKQALRAWFPRDEAA